MDAYFSVTKGHLMSKSIGDTSHPPYSVDQPLLQQHHDLPEKSWPMTQGLLSVACFVAPACFFGGVTATCFDGKKISAFEWVQAVVTVGVNAFIYWLGLLSLGSTLKNTYQSLSLDQLKRQSCSELACTGLVKASKYYLVANFAGVASLFLVGDVLRHRHLFSVPVVWMLGLSGYLMEASIALKSNNDCINGAINTVKDVYSSFALLKLTEGEVSALKSFLGGSDKNSVLLDKLNAVKGDEHKALRFSRDEAMELSALFDENQRSDLAGKLQVCPGSLLSALRGGMTIKNGVKSLLMLGYVAPLSFLMTFIGVGSMQRAIQWEGLSFLKYFPVNLAWVLQSDQWAVTAGAGFFILVSQYLLESCYAILEELTAPILALFNEKKRGEFVKAPFETIKAHIGHFVAILGIGGVSLGLGTASSIPVFDEGILKMLLDGGVNAKIIRFALSAGLNARVLAVAVAGVFNAYGMLQYFYKREKSYHKRMQARMQAANLLLAAVIIACNDQQDRAALDDDTRPSAEDQDLHVPEVAPPIKEGLGEWVGKKMTAASDAFFSVFGSPVPKQDEGDAGPVSDTREDVSTTYGSV